MFACICEPIRAYVTVQQGWGIAQTLADHAIETDLCKSFVVRPPHHELGTWAKLDVTQRVASRSRPDGFGHSDLGRIHRREGYSWANRSA